MVDDKYRRLAEYVLRRREQELGLSRPAITARGGPSISIQQQIEGNKVQGHSESTYAREEIGLGWAPGSIAAVIEGGEPTVMENTAPAAGPGNSDVLTGVDGEAWFGVMLGQALRDAPVAVRQRAILRAMRVALEELEKGAEGEASSAGE